MTTTPNDPYGSPGYGEGESTSALPDDTSGTSDYSTGTTDYSTGTEYSAETPGYDSGTDDYSGGDSDSSSGAAQAAKDEAKNVKDTAAQATSQVADTAKQQATQVAGDVRDQAKQLATETKTQLSDQATSQRDRAAEALLSMSSEFRSMAESSSSSGMAAQLARQGADLTEKASYFLSEREPSQILDEVRGLARRRPGQFLVGSAVAGVLAGRMSRGAISARSDDSSSDHYDDARMPAQPGGQYPPAAGQYDVYGSESTSTAPPTASGWSPSAAQPAPILNEPYGEQQPPAGYDPGYGGRP